MKQVYSTLAALVITTTSCFGEVVNYEPPILPEKLEPALMHDDAYFSNAKVCTGFYYHKMMMITTNFAKSAKTPADVAPFFAKAMTNYDKLRRNIMKFSLLDEELWQVIYFQDAVAYATQLTAEYKDSHIHLGTFASCSVDSCKTDSTNIQRYIDVTDRHQRAYGFVCDAMLQ